MSKYAENDKYSRLLRKYGLKLDNQSTDFELALKSHQTLISYLELKKNESLSEAFKRGMIWYQDIEKLMEGE